MSSLQTVNPATGETLKEYPCHTNAEVQAMLGSLHDAQQAWAKLPLATRIEPLKKLEQLLLDNVDRHAQLMTDEMGKPIEQSRAEVKKCARLCDYYADNALCFLKDEPIETTYPQSFISFEPLGIVYGIMPWNFPYWQVFRFAIPAMTAGNGALLKHASNTTGCGLAIRELLIEAGYPKHLFQQVLLPGKEAEAIIDDPRISAVTLTGSERAGMAVASHSGKLLKKTVLELGGSDAFIVLADADLDACVQTAVKARLLNTGQSCIAAKRFIIEESIHDEFVSKLKAALNSVSVGPLARDDLRWALHTQVEKSLAEGATLLAGGHMPDGPGFFYPTTLLTNCTNGMTCCQEETFGPLFTVQKARDATHAIQIANDSRYGLGGALWTADTTNGIALARQIQTGTVAVNGMTASDPALPFGGVKLSGYGRELSHYGLKEFVNIKTIIVAS